MTATYIAFVIEHREVLLAALLVCWCLFARWLWQEERRYQFACVGVRYAFAEWYLTCDPRRARYGDVAYQSLRLVRYGV